ncbi:MAG: hypothetical protein APU95_04370 [Hadesarchaea archaeon YNP_N21]|jgi:NADH-quinone oxidoreductase subunit H|nr:MAG: hypothetical protein APU95_04370 [Hadesarchaea archaeon YNP_N21]
MEILTSLLSFIASYLIFPGLAFSALAGMLYMGVDRKLTGHMQNRIGPPIWQEFYDIGKLFLKEDITPKASQSWLFNCAPMLGLGSIVTVMLLLPFLSQDPAVSLAADLIVIIYLLNIPAICMMLGGYASASPFGIVGASRYMVQLFGYELVFIISVLAAAIRAGSLSLSAIVEFQSSEGPLVYQLKLLPAFLAVLIAVQGKLMRAPFHIPEAETEIIHGPLTEYSGPKLALMRLAYDIETFAVFSLIAILFLGGPIPLQIYGIEIPGVIMLLLKIFFILLISTAFRNAVARLRIDQALKLFWLFASLLALVSLVLVV